MPLQSQFDINMVLDGLVDKQSNVVYLALSGGVDSVSLLHLLAHARQQQDFDLRALHVNHGLHRNSGVWEEYCSELCNEYDVEFYSTQLDLPDASEATARTARYDWIRQFARYGDVIITAHHLQDRAETLLFNLTRGCGGAGLSSLKGARSFYGAKLIRPLLSAEKSEIIQYAEKHSLSWVEDPSNNNDKYSRNRIRNSVLPALTSYRADAVRNIARAACNLEQENELLREIAIGDLTEVREFSRHLIDRSHAICFADLSHLSSARQSNLLRFWLGSLDLHIPSKSLMNELVKAIAKPPSATAIMQEEGTQFRFYRDYLYVMPDVPPNQSFKPMLWPNLDQPLALFEERVKVGATQKLRQLCQSSESGQVQLLPRENLLNPRAIQGHSLNLKKWLQDVGVPPWRRTALPILAIRQAERDLILAPVDQHVNTDWVDVQQYVA